VTPRLRALLGVVALLVLCSGIPTGPAGAAPRAVTVAVNVVSPFVVSNGDQWTGFTVDLWNEIAQRQGWTTDVVVVEDVPAMLETVATGRADVGASGVSITAAREQDFDFSQPILDAGLQIIVPARSTEVSSPGLTGFLELLFSKLMLLYLFAALVITLLPAHILWLVERRHADSTMARTYFPGIFQAFGWGLGMLAARVDASPRHGAARLVATLWALVSVIFVAFYTANLTAALTVAKLESSIRGPADLYDKTVATVSNTTSSAYLRRMGIAATEMPGVEDCYRALRERQLDAVVFDAPVLHHYVAHQGAGVAVVAGPIFQEEDYGLVLRLGSDLRKPVDQSLLGMREDGTYDVIYQRWFGDDGID
jgi:polar amino acid transport system substrate-binding protein